MGVLDPEDLVSYFLHSDSGVCVPNVDVDVDGDVDVDVDVDVELGCFSARVGGSWYFLGDFLRDFFGIFSLDIFSWMDGDGWIDLDLRI